VIRRAALAAALALAAACAPRATVAPGPTPLPIPLESTPRHDEPALAGVVHVVRRGETIYRIARAYRIDPADLMETNGIADPRNVAVGTELFVPGATRVVEVGASSTSTSTSTPTPSPSPTPTSTATPTATTSPTSTSTSAVHPEPLDQARDRLRDAAPAAERSRGTTPTKTPSSTSRVHLAWPLKGVLYGRYGVRAGQRHDGIDIAAPEGASVTAAAAGTVVYAGEQPGYGAVVILKHEGGLATVYAHNSRVLVREGTRVEAGAPIARVGQTGRTTGPHLHFEVREGTRPKNPLLYLP